MMIELRTALKYASVASFVMFLCVVEGIGALRPPAAQAHALPIVSGALSLGNGFKPEAVYPSTDRTNVPAGLNLYGSWIGSDTSTGTASTAWYAAVPQFSMMVAGYPNNSQMMLTIQTADAQGHMQTSPVTSANSQESWVMVPVTLSNADTAKRFRILASDMSTASRGWLGFSEPFVLDVRKLPAMGTVGVASMYVAAVLSFILGVLCGLGAWNKRLFPSGQ